MSAFPGVSSYQSSSLGSKFVVIGVVCCQEMRRNALFHKVLPVLTKYLEGKSLHENERFLSIVNLANQLPDDRQPDAVIKIIESSLKDISCWVNSEE